MWIPVTASAQGLAYAHEGRNNQDAVASWSDGNTAIVFINDGCHGGKFSEVGARLSSGFLVRKSQELLLRGLPLVDLSVQLFSSYLEYLEWQVETQFFTGSDEIQAFISDYLLCTALGIITTQKEVMTLSCGDGSFILNNNIIETIRSPFNYPVYPAYNLITRFGLESTESLEKLTPSLFKTTLFPASDVQSVGMTSDGLNDFPKLVEELRNNSQTSIRLQLCLNRISMIRAETTDNVSIAFVHKKEA